MNITRNQLLTYQLQRQGLIERLPVESILRLGAFPTADHTTPYLALLARIADFEWQHLADHLYDDMQLMNIVAMRQQPHLIPADHSHAAHCLYDVRESDPFPEFADFGMDMDEALELRFEINQILRVHGAQSVGSIQDMLRPDLVRLLKTKRGKQELNIALVLRWMWRLGLLDWGEGVHHWRTRDNGYLLAANPPTDCDPTQQQAAALDLARWYFSVYAPAAYEDWAWWGGLSDDVSQAAFDALEPELVTVSVSDISQTLWLPQTEEDALRNAPNALPEMVRLLPGEDPLIKAYSATRHRFYDDDELAADVAFNKHGQLFPTLMLDGRIVGVWDWTRKANEPMTIEPFLQPTRTFRKRLKPEVDRVKAFIEASQIVWTM